MELKPLIPFGWLRAFLFLTLLLLLSQFAFFFIYEKIFSKTSLQSLQSTATASLGEMVKYYFSVLAINLLLVVVCRKFLDGKNIYSLGFAWKKNESNAATGFFSPIIILGVGALILVIAGYVKFIAFEIDAHDIFFAALLFILVAINEEIIFRGYLLTNLMQSLNRFIALALSALMFALFHINNPQIDWLAIINIFLAGILLGINYIFTKNIWFSIFFHFTWNFFQGAILGFKVSGIQIKGMFTQVESGPAIFTGNNFGYEGSAICSILLLAFIIIFTKHYYKNYGEKNTLREIIKAK